jgi:hypothetical protein
MRLGQTEARPRDTVATRAGPRPREDGGHLRAKHLRAFAGEVGLRDQPRNDGGDLGSAGRRWLDHVDEVLI